MRKGILLILMMALTIGSTSLAFADAGNDDMKAEINALKARLAQLEAKVAEQPQSQMAGMNGAPAVAPALTVPSLVQGVGISGYVDSIYSYNFNSPDNITSSNTARVFDRHPNSFELNAAQLIFKKPVSADSRVGFLTDIFAGKDSQVITSAGLGTATDEFDLKQAYAEVLVPTSNAIKGLNDIDLKIGKFVTMNGAEVIESKDNWNTSRSLLFGYAIPFTHTGVRGTYTFNNGWDMALGVVNGWDVTDDNNNGKTIETHFGFNSLALPGDSSLTVALQGYFGPEQTGNDHSYRNLFDMVVTYKTPWKPLTLMYNYDYANESDLLTDPNSTKATLVDSANWQGHAVYARIDINDQWSVSTRYEYFEDNDHVRIVVPAGTPAADVYQEITGTLEYRPWKNIVTRLEYRHDDANQPVFLDQGTPAFSKTQDTLSGEVMYIF